MILDIELKTRENNKFSDYYLFNSLEEPIRFLPNFNEINVIIGANNSGKSRFLRSLMNISNLTGVHKSESLVNGLCEFNNLVEELDLKVKVSQNTINLLIQDYFSSMKLDKLSVKSSSEIEFTKIEIDLYIKELNEQIELNILVSEKLSLLFNYYKSNSIERSKFLNTLYVNGIHNNSYSFINSIEPFEEIRGLLEKLKSISNKYKEFIGGKIYIPTLRSAHSLFMKQREGIKGIESTDNLLKIRKNIFQDTIRKNYKNLGAEVEIFTGLSLYDEIVNVRNSIKEERVKFHAFEKFLSTNFFNREDIDVVAKFNIHNNEKGIDEDDIIQVFIGGKSRKLHNLGDGVQALIILMYKIFLAEENSLIFIDEPELNLHPGFQRLFLEQIKSNPELTKKNLTYVIVTHSNHFLDLTLEKDNVSIYSFSSLDKDKFLIKNVNSGDNQTLRNLGVNNSSVFLANCSIWVEGISDRNFIKAFLKAYCSYNDLQEPREDIDYAFFEYAGSNLQHYNFKKNESEYDIAKGLINSYALNNRVFLLSDYDSGTEARHNNLTSIANELDNFNYSTTKPYREIENLLGKNVWEKVLLNFCNRNKVEDREKVQNKIIASLNKVQTEEYKSNYIGEFLKELNVSELKKIWKIDNEGKAGTFIYKAELSKLVLDKVINNEMNWEELASNNTVVSLTESVYNFIKN
ncbi:AAA family ATPase [Seonamhaeicola marinus]|uniref:ATP-binding protein n=1 Tax=Seonamhaeicola marinus TaxID=1912246 RepID=A0A5D0HKP3_9FLAO|nr:AAA family ATPase [Seonamhaeicola marinus]TYA69872.1 ATP-binding protein [Seonamhaeicola marinus]